MTRTTWPAALAVLITTAAQAGDCRNFSRGHDQIVLVPPTVQYFVGAPLRQQALAYGTAPGYGPPAPQVYGQPPAQGYGQPPAQPVSPQDWAAFQAWKAQQLQQQPQQNQPGPPPGGQAAAPNPAASAEKSEMSTSLSRFASPRRIPVVGSSRTACHATLTPSMEWSGY